MPTSKVEGHVGGIENVTIQQYAIDQVDPHVQPRVLVWIYYNVLQAHFVSVYQFLIVKVMVKVVATLINAVETVHILLLLRLIGFIERRHKEVNFLIHILNMVP